MPKPVRWTYLLVYHEGIGSYEKVRRFLDSRKEILNWGYYLPNTFLIVSELTANQLTELFRKLTKDQHRFIILDTKTDRNGWLPKEAWELMRNPRAVGEKP